MAYSVNYSRYVSEGNNYEGFEGYRDTTLFCKDYQQLHIFLQRVYESVNERHPIIVQSIHEYQWITEVTKVITKRFEQIRHAQENENAKKKAEQLRLQAQQLMDEASKLEK